MRFLDDPQLYDNYDYFAKHFSWQPTAVRQDRLIYHCYWTGRLTKHQLLSIKSLLISQSEPFEVWLWMSKGDLAANREILAKLESLSCFSVREYNIARETASTPYRRYIKTLTGGTKPTPLQKADGLRMLVLAKYGGVYFDLDVLFLKDIRPLCGVNFCYQWSRQKSANNAVMHGFRSSSDLMALLERGKRIGTFHPRFLFQFAECNAITNMWVFPSFVFDPTWIANDHHLHQNEYCNSFDDFFVRRRSIKLVEFFPAAYTYHWHNRWTRTIRPRRIVGQLQKEILAKYQELCYTARPFQAQTLAGASLVNLHGP